MKNIEALVVAIALQFILYTEPSSAIVKGGESEDNETQQCITDCRANTTTTTGATSVADAYNCSAPDADPIECGYDGPVCVLDENITVESECVLLCGLTEMSELPVYELRSCDEVPIDATPDPAVTYTTTAFKTEYDLPENANCTTCTVTPPPPDHGILQVELNGNSIDSVSEQALLAAIESTFAATPFVGDSTSAYVISVQEDSTSKPGVYNVTYYDEEKSEAAKDVLVTMVRVRVYVGLTVFLAQWYDPFSTSTVTSTTTSTASTMTTSTQTTAAPTFAPTLSPSTDSPTTIPTALPTDSPTSSPVSAAPTASPTGAPSVSASTIRLTFTKYPLHTLGTNLRNKLATNIQTVLVSTTTLTSDQIAGVTFTSIPGVVRHRQRRQQQTGFYADVQLTLSAGIAQQSDVNDIANTLAVTNPAFVDPVDSSPLYASSVGGMYGETGTQTFTVITQSPTVSPTMSPTPAPAKADTDLGTSSGSSSSDDDDDVSSGAIAGIVILVIVALVLIGLAIKKYREPEPWRKGANFAKLIGEDEEGQLGSPNGVLAKSTDLNMELARRTSLDMGLPIPVDGGYVESSGTEVKAISPISPEAIVSKVKESKINQHPTLRKEPFENRASTRSVGLGLEDEMYAVYPVAGSEDRSLHVSIEAATVVTATTTTAAIKTASTAPTSIQLGNMSQETKIDAVSLSSSVGAESTTDATTSQVVRLGHSSVTDASSSVDGQTLGDVSGETTTDPRKASAVDISNVDPLNMHHLVKHGLVESENEFKEVPNAFGREKASRQSQC